MAIPLHCARAVVESQQGARQIRSNFQVVLAKVYGLVVILSSIAIIDRPCYHRHTMPACISVQKSYLQVIDCTSQAVWLYRAMYQQNNRKISGTADMTRKSNSRVYVVNTDRHGRLTTKRPEWQRLLRTSAPSRHFLVFTTGSTSRTIQ